MGSLVGKDKRVSLGSMAMNQQQNSGSPSNPHPGGDILLEDGSFLLQETGDYTFLLEQQ